MREPTGAFFPGNFQFPGHREKRKLAVIVDPRTGLVCLLEALNMCCIVGIHPAVAHFGGLRRPEIHSPGHGNGRVGVSVRQRLIGIGAHKRIDVIYYRKGLAKRIIC